MSNTTGPRTTGGEPTTGIAWGARNHVEQALQSRCFVPTG